MTLYEINEQVRNFQFEIDEETGEITNLQELDQLNLEKNDKVENIALFIKELDAEAKAIREEEKALADRRRVKENKVESLKNYLTNNLNGEKFETSKVKISYRKSEKVICNDLTLVPSDFLRFKEPELDKTKVKYELKLGKEIEGCTLEESISMQIK